MAIQYEKLYKKMGMRKLEHYLKPRVVDARIFSFPISSSFHYWKVSPKAEYFTSDNTYLTDVDKANVRTITSYDEKFTDGKFMEKVFLVNKFITENTKACKEYKFLKPEQELKCNDRVLKVNNYAALNECYRYNNQPMLEYVTYKNVLNTVLGNLFIDSDRSHYFILMELPNKLLTRVEYDKFSKNLRPGNMELFQDYRSFNVLELWKFISPEFKSNSVFNRIPKSSYNKVNFLFYLENKIMLVNLQYLMGSIAESGVVYESIKPKKGDAFKKMFYITLTEFLATPAMSEQELENLEKNLDSNPEQTVVETKEQPEVSVEPSSRFSIRRFVSGLVNKPKPNDKPQKFNSISDMVGKLREANKTVEIEDPIKKKIEKDDFIDEAIEDTIKKVEENQSDDLYQELVKNIAEAKAEADVSKDDWEENEKGNKPSLLEQKINKTEIQISEDEIDLPTLGQLESELYDYTNVVTKIDYLQLNKVIDKKKANNLKNIVEKQAKQKDPYKSDLTIGEMLDDEKDKLDLELDKILITDNKVVFDKNYNKDTANKLRKEYILNQYHKDIIRCVYGLQNGNVIVENYEVKTIEDGLGTLEDHTVTFKTLDGKSHTCKFYLPLIRENGEIVINNQTYMQRFQRNNLPITKLKATEVKLSTYYGRHFVTKALYKKDDIGYFIMQQLAKKYDDPKGDIRDLIMLPSKNEEVELPLDYAHFSRYTKAFKFKNYQFNFEYKNRINLFKDLTQEDLDHIEDDKNLVLIGHEKGTPILMDFDNNVYRLNGKKYEAVSDSLFHLLDIDKSLAPIEFTVIKIFKQNIPTVLLLSYYLGLTNLLKVLEMSYSFIEPRQRAATDNHTMAIKFQDTKLVIRRDHGLGDMIVGGLLSIQKILKDLPYKVLNDKSAFAALANKLEYSLLYMNEIRNMETLFIDPITLTILKKFNMPTSFKGVLIEANKLLLDDNYKNPNNMKAMCIKGYERIAGMIYYELVKAIREYEGKTAFSRAKINLNPYNIISAIQEDSTTVLVDDLNPVAAIKQTEDVSYLGALGASKETLARSTRIFNESEVGVISEAVKDSGDVGITAYMTAAPKIEDLRGTIGDYDLNKDGIAGAYSTSALLAPFGLQDDGKRLKIRSSI